MRGFKSANSELQLRTGVGWGAEGELDEPSPLPQHRELTVNIRGNDIDFKELWLQMSLMFSLSLLRKKKKTLPCVIYILSFLCFSVPLLGKTAPIVQTLGSKGHSSYENQP